MRFNVIVPFIHVYLRHVHSNHSLDYSNTLWAYTRCGSLLYIIPLYSSNEIIQSTRICLLYKHYTCTCSHYTKPYY